MQDKHLRKLLQGENLMDVVRKLEEESVRHFDFTRKELDYILENANFTIEQEEIFKMLTSRYGRASIVNISIKMNMSESSVKRRIKQIKSKILRLV